jgi:hypothetical protein
MQGFLKTPQLAEPRHMSKWELRKAHPLLAISKAKLSFLFFELQRKSM